MTETVVNRGVDVVKAPSISPKGEGNLEGKSEECY